MQLENQVCSLELAKKLKEIGVKQESYFQYHAWENPLSEALAESLALDSQWILGSSHDNKFLQCSDWKISAFTVAELGAMLPEAFRFFKKWYIYTEHKLNTWWALSYSTVQNENYFPTIESHNNAETRAKMLIFLIENKLIEPN